MLASSILSRTKIKKRQALLHVGYRKADRKEAVLNADYIIHLAGANIAEKPWTRSGKSKSLLVENSLPYLLRSKEK
jgi:NAD dependent epimerase/dehydratase family enzyme